MVQRHALGWMILVALLVGLTGAQMLWSQRAFSRETPVSGGVYAEGVVGPLEVINPLFASTSAEQSASRLVFSSLLSYDRYNRLRGELADTWRVENGGKRYVLTLRQTVSWHDGRAFTADDVVFTVNRIKNPLTRSALYGSWRDVSVAKLGTYQVAFDLSQPYAPFLHALTFGILPVHLLNDVSPEQLRESAFNRSPIGTGPFAFTRLQTINAESGRYVVYLTANQKFMRGAPKLDRFQLHVFADHDAVARAFSSGEINAATDIIAEDVDRIVAQQPQSRQSHAPLYDGVYAFLRTDSGMLNDIAVRQALRLATDRPAIIKAVKAASSLDGPLVRQQYGFVSQKRQPGFDRVAAEKLLDQAGWPRGVNGIRAKDGLPLRLSVVAPRSGDFPKVLEKLVSNWRAIGVDIETQLVTTDNIQQNVLLPRAYDVFVYELAIGADPDVFAYWHSSQADPRGLNLANYRSTKADEALASAQSRLEADLRQRKYETFVDQWLVDTPAIALYQPVLPYVTTDTARSLLLESDVIDAADRYRSVENWTINVGRSAMTP